MCCAPLLARWFISHLPKLVLKNKEGMGWAYRIMYLSHNDIIWTIKGMEDVAIIDHCGEYPNVLLLGINGGSLIIRVWPYVSLGELEGKDLMSY